MSSFILDVVIEGAARWLLGAKWYERMYVVLGVIAVVFLLVSIL